MVLAVLRPHSRAQCSVPEPVLLVVRRPVLREAKDVHGFPQMLGSLFNESKRVPRSEVITFGDEPGNGESSGLELDAVVCPREPPIPNAAGRQDVFEC